MLRFPILILIALLATVLAEPHTSGGNGRSFISPSVSSFGQRPEEFDNLEHTPTNQYAVIFHDDHKRSMDLTEFARRHGLVYERKLMHHEDVHLFNIVDETENIPHISTAREVMWHERQVLKRRYRRTNDPLYQGAWNLHGHPHHMNVEGAWELGVTGAGVTVCIVDDGIYHQHPEFAGRFVARASRDINFNDDDISPYTWDYHGTASAGVATAAADNGVCNAGIAPGASISGVRILARDASDAQEAEGVTFRSDLNDIYSNSWGPNDNGKTLEGPGRLLKSAMENAIEHGRGGKGSIFVWAGGNGRESGDSCNYDGYASSRFTIAIGSYEFNGRQAYYSESCPALIAMTPSSDRSGHQITSCGVGNQCYTHFGGTSASSPAAAGVVALMLEARPDLTWRDVQGVLIESAVPIDTTDDDWVATPAGLMVNHKYGYGMIDAALAVQLSRQWSLLPEYVSASAGTSASRTIPQGRHALVDTLTITEEFIVEHVEVTVNVNHRHRGEVHIELISPSGIASVFAERHDDQSANYSRWVFTSMRHWGEGSSGTWGLSLLDEVNNSESGQLRGWSIVVYGH